MLEIDIVFYVKGRLFLSRSLEIDLLKSDVDSVRIPDRIELSSRGISLVFMRSSEFDVEAVRALAPAEREPDFTIFTRSSLAIKYEVQFDYLYSLQRDVWHDLDTYEFRTFTKLLSQTNTDIDLA